MAHCKDSGRVGTVKGNVRAGSNRDQAEAEGFYNKKGCEEKQRKIQTHQ